MARKKNVEKELYWRELITRQAVSGLSIQQFCENEDISRPSFYGWRRRLREGEDNGTRRRESRPRQEEGVVKHEFIPLKLLESPCGLEIIHPQGYQIRVTGGVDVDTLRQVLDVLDGRGAG
jgi:transposase